MGVDPTHFRRHVEIIIVGSIDMREMLCFGDGLIPHAWCRDLAVVEKVISKLAADLQANQAHLTRERPAQLMVCSWRSPKSTPRNRKMPTV